MPLRRSLAATIRHEIPRIKGSRFLAEAAPATDATAAGALVERLRAEFPEATHHCYAWRLGDGSDEFRAFDDGEPSGTAGLPILRQVDGRGLTDVAVVVVRWFGGTKLGTGGLVRAYAAAARAALDHGEVVEAEATRPLRISCEWALQGAVRGVLVAWGLRPDDVAYGERVVQVVGAPLDRWEQLARDLRESTAGRAEIEPL